MSAILLYANTKVFTNEQQITGDGYKFVCYVNQGTVFFFVFIYYDLECKFEMF